MVPDCMCVGGREGGREGERERGREGGREGGREQAVNTSPSIAASQACSSRVKENLYGNEAIIIQHCQYTCNTITSVLPLTV